MEDEVWGSDGDDWLTGGEGSNRLYGMGGVDTVAYSGLLSRYGLRIGTDGVFRIVDSFPSDGDEGPDSLTGGVEQVAFEDVALTLYGGFAITPAGLADASDSAMAVLADGGILVLWQARADHGNGHVVMARRYSAGRQPLGGEFLIIDAGAEDFRHPDIARGGDGRLLAVWQSSLPGLPGAGLYGRMLAADGTPSGGVMALDLAGDVHGRPSVAALDGGGFVVAWTALSQAGDGWRIMACRTDSGGALSGEPVVVSSGTAGSREYPRVAALAGGGFQVTWAGEGGGDSFGIQTRGFDALGQALGPAGRLNTTSADYQWYPATAVLADGSRVVVWQGAGSGDSSAILARRLDAAGNPLSGEMRVNVTVAGDQREPVVTALAGGGFAVAWVSDEAGVAPLLLVRFYAADGQALGGETAVSPDDGRDISKPAIVALPDGGAFISWTENRGSDGRGLAGRYFDGSGRALVAETVGGLYGTAGADTLVLADSTAGVVLMGGDGHDWLQGGAADDRLSGGRGNDTYVVAAGDDRVLEAPSHGTDTIISHRSLSLPDHVEVLQLAGDAAIDGNGNGLDNLLEGNAAANRIDGGGGDDVLLLQGVSQGRRFGFDAAGDLTVETPGEAADRISRIERLRFPDREWELQGEFRANQVRTNSQRAPVMSVLPSGDVLHAWWGYGEGDPIGVFARVLPLSGRAPAAESALNTYVSQEQRFPSLAPLIDGRTVAVWMSSGQDGSGWGVYGRLLDSQGRPSGVEFRVNETTINSQQMPVVAATPDGGFVVAWQGYGAGDGAGIHARRFVAGAEPAGGELRVNNLTAGEQRDPALAVLADGSWVVAWGTRDADGSSGLAARRFGADGQPAGAEFILRSTPTDQGSPALAALADGGFLAVWQEASPAAPIPREALLTASRELPFLEGGTPTGGFTCTGLDRITRGPYAGCWLVGSDGRRLESAESAGDGEVLILSEDFTTVMARFELGLPGGVQGVAVDTSGTADSFWVTDVRHGLIRHYSLEGGGELVDDRIDWRALTGGTPNGLAYDPDAGALWVGAVAGSAFTLVSCLDGSLVRTVRGGTDADQFDYDPVRRLLYYSSGSNGADGQIRAVQVDQDSGSFPLYGPLAGVQAIEGIDVDAATGRLTVLNDGGFHLAAFPARNLALTYAVSPLSPAEATAAAGNGGIDIWGQRFSAVGTALSPPERINRLPGQDQTNPAVTMLADGGWVVTWQSRELDGSASGIFARCYDASGAAMTDDFQVNTWTDSIQDMPSVSALPDGGFMIAWQSLNQDGSGYSVQSRRFNAQAQPLTTVTGSALDDVMDFSSGTAPLVLNGDAGDDRLTGGAGADVLSGGDGDDTYVIGDLNDRLLEAAGGGRDVVWSAVDYALAENSHIEDLLLTGRAQRGSGNAGDNRLTGNNAGNQLVGAAGHDWLDGGLGADTLSGGTGDDTYVVDALDRITELAGEGTDCVMAAVSWTLGNHLEQLILTGSTAVYGTGNSLDNRLTGNSLNNQLAGGAGNDTLLGGAGSDTLKGEAGQDWLQGGAGSDALQGGAGNDTYLVMRGDGTDTLTEADGTPGNQDLLWFADASIACDQLWFRQSAQDLEVSVAGTTTRVVVKGWFGGTAGQVEEILAGDGRRLLAADVSLLVSVMAALTPPAPGATAGVTGRHAELDSLLGLVWR